MNKIVNNLAMISDAAEYFDRKVGAAWKIRSALTNMGVWAANSYIGARQAGDLDRIVNSAIVLATIRTWLHDCNESGLVLDLTPSSVRRTLGLDRVVDIHEEACREARTKCIQTRSAVNFKNYYDAAVQAHEERRLQREERVEEISNLLADSSIRLDDIDGLRDYMELSLANSHQRPTSLGADVDDATLYDEDMVQRQADTLAEVVGNALEAMYDVCDAELAAAITTDKINRLSGYHNGLMQMMNIAGVDTKKLAERRVKLEAQIAAQISTVVSGVAAIDADIQAQMMEMEKPQAEAAPTKPRRGRTIKKDAVDHTA